MAKQESAFDLKHIEETAVVETSGVLDQLNFPPALVDFLRKNQRTIWIVIGVMAAVVTVVSLYGSYRSYTMKKAARAYDQAVMLEGEAQKAALQKIVDSFGSTPSAVWSRVQLAHFEQTAGDTKGAVQKLSAINSSLTKESLLKPLVLVDLGGLYEQEKQLDQAIAAYQELQAFKGFEDEAVRSLGRVYEAQGNKEQAAAMYQKYLTLTTREGTEPQRDDPVRTMARAALNRLQQ